MTIKQMETAIMDGDIEESKIEKLELVIAASKTFSKTIQEELTQQSNAEARRGYVVIELVDEPTRTGDDNKSGKYIFIYDYNSETPSGEINSKMVLYEFNLDSEWVSLVTNDKTQSESIFQSVDNKNIQLPAIPVYAGCSISIHVIDQSQDVEAMKTSEFDDMIGYKFNGKIEQEYFTNNYEDETKPALFATEDNGYELTISSSDQIDGEVVSKGILSKGYGNRSLVVLKLHFEKIKYTIDFDIDLKKVDGTTDTGNDFYSGSIELNGQTQSAKLTNITLTVEESYKLKYIAN